MPFQLTMELHVELHRTGKGKKAAKAGTGKAGAGKRKTAGSAGGAGRKRAKVVAHEENEKEDVPEFVFADEDEEEDPEALFERFRAGEIGNPSLGWGAEEAIELDSD